MNIPRRQADKPKKKHCHDCGVAEGQIHKYGCDMEVCPFCGKQLITCGCFYTILNLDISEGTYTYEHGLTEQQELRWLSILNKKGRIPYFLYPNLCRRCGKLWPEMFTVSNERWARVVEPLMRREMLCRECFDYMENAVLG